MNTNDPQLPDDFEFDSETGAYFAERDDSADRSLTEAITTGVAAISGRGVTELEPLYRVVNPDALDALFSPTKSGAPRPGGRLSFVFENHEVTVRRGGTVVIRPPGCKHGTASAPHDGVSNA